MKLLLVEDDADLARIIVRWLEHEGHRVDWSTDGQDGFAKAASGDYRCIILDWMLPGMPGIDVCARLRQRKVNTPVLMLTARDSTQDKVEGLESGADDYLAKPFEMDELHARIRALSRRDAANRGRTIRLGTVEIDVGIQRVTVDGAALNLTKREYLLFEALARYQGRTLSREFILDTIWNCDETLSNSVDVHIASLRRKLGQSPSVPTIRTVHREGYCLDNVPMDQTCCEK